MTYADYDYFIGQAEIKREAQREDRRKRWRKNAEAENARRREKYRNDAKYRGEKLEYQRKYTKENAEVVNKRRKTDPVYYARRQEIERKSALKTSSQEMLLRNARWRAKNKLIAFDITVDDLDWPTHCPIFGVELVYRRTGQGKNGRVPHPYAASLDRRDNGKGYIKGNVSVISWRANKLKGNATAEELAALARYAAGELNVKPPNR